MYVLLLPVLSAARSFVVCGTLLCRINIAVGAVGGVYEIADITDLKGLMFCLVTAFAVDADSST